jgi:hypothetical protein
MTILNIILTKQETKLKNRIANILSYHDEPSKHEFNIAIILIKAFGMKINDLPDFSLRVFALLFELGDRQIEHLFIGIDSKRAVTNAANCLVRHELCYWDTPNASDIEYGNYLIINRDKYLISEAVRYTKKPEKYIS